MVHTTLVVVHTNVLVGADTTLVPPVKSTGQADPTLAQDSKNGADTTLVVVHTKMLVGAHHTLVPPLKSTGQARTAHGHR